MQPTQSKLPNAVVSVGDGRAVTLQILGNNQSITTAKGAAKVKSVSSTPSKVLKASCPFLVCVIKVYSIRLIIRTRSKL